jgi:predicted amidohydrolase YtcJ
MILDNANVLTMDDALPRAKVLAIAGGKVLGGVDSREDAIASHAHERVDLRGLTVVPGFVESHCHFRAWALEQHRLRLHDVANAEELLARVREREGDWVLGGGWPDALAGAIDESQLDAAAAGRPVALHSRDGHAVLVNAAALERLGIDRPAGVLREQDAFLVREALPMDDLDTKAMATAMRAAARRGVTSLHDMDGAAALRAWRRLEDERGLALRVWVHVLAADLPHLEALGVGGGWGSDRLAIGALKVFADGTLGSGTALLHEPELPLPGREPREGVAVTPLDELRRLARRAGAAGMPLAVHAIGDRAFSDALEALEATREHWDHLPMRPRIEHAQLVRTEDLPRAAALGVALSVQPSMLVTDRDEATARWGAERTARAYAYRSMLDAGCGLLFGSDAPIEPLDPLAAIRAAVLRDGFHPEQAVDPEAALLASTAWPADASGESHRLGRLVPGRDADLVVLSGDPLADPLESIEVVATMVGGRWTHGAASLPAR